MVGDGVNDVVVTDLEYTVAVDAGLCCAACLEDALFGGVANTVRIVLVFGHRNGVFVVDCVLVAIEGGINAEGEHVLVEWGHDTGADVRSPWNGCAGFFVVEGNGGQNTSCSHLEFNVGSLIEDKGEDVFIVANCADHLSHQLTVSDYRRSAGTVVCMLMLQAVVLLMKTDDILQLDRCSL